MITGNWGNMFVRPSNLRVPPLFRVSRLDALRLGYFAATRVTQ